MPDTASWDALRKKRTALKADLALLVASEDWVRLSFAAQMLLDFDQQLAHPVPPHPRTTTGRRPAAPRKTRLEVSP